ncbi:MAG: proprotein convertase P-domain-containing protein, partial [Chrysiogenetes bacterium]|nr:proprotein convertase P-domain-containing protein [Chrysiogenetes bacterium]
DAMLPRRVERASVAQGRVQAEDAALFPTISGLGNWVAYESDAGNIDFTDSGSFSDIFLYDRTTKQTSRASVSIDPITGMISEANGNSHSPSLNADPGDAGIDGRFLVFESFANNIATRYETVGTGDNSTTIFNKVLFERSAVPGSFKVTDGMETCTDDMAGTLVCDNGGSGTIVYASSTLTLTFGTAPAGGAPVIATYATSESDANSLDLFVLDRDADDNNIFDEDPALVAGARRISRLTLNDGGGDTDSNSFRPRISADGRHVVFMSLATNLVASDTNDAADIFIHDRDVDGMGTYDDGADIAIIRVSVSTAGTEANDDSERPWISNDGRYVVFDSFATNLVAGDTNGESDVFLRDRDTDGNGIFDEMSGVSTVRLSVPLLGGETDGASEQGTISNDGRFVAFVSDATNLVAGDTNFFADVFVLDRDRDNNQVYDEVGETEIRRVNIPPLGRETDDESFAAWISPGGASVVLASDATNLDPLDSNNLGDIFIVPNLMAPISSAGQTLFFDAQPPQIPLDIADFSTVLSTITVDATGTVQDINVEVDISHSFSGDLTITLIAPDATEVILSDGNGDDAINAFSGTVFDDEAPFGIVDVTPPYSGRFQPEGDLVDLQGKSVQGTWTLKVTDCCDPDGGQLDFWGIELELQ